MSMCFDLKQLSAHISYGVKWRLFCVLLRCSFFFVRHLHEHLFETNKNCLFNSACIFLTAGEVLIASGGAASAVEAEVSITTV